MQPFRISFYFFLMVWNFEGLEKDRKVLDDFVSLRFHLSGKSFWIRSIKRILCKSFDLEHVFLFSIKGKMKLFLAKCLSSSPQENLYFRKQFHVSVYKELYVTAFRSTTILI
ncbi:MAG TPA: hypothetical protein DDZ96_08455 [Porphyromonadaceae bacterium]|nr:hypothetical protein [Porphyromonadaceae bacterium]HBK32823.1 hypothetical protein [Porphyromonadaceae bacterium]HBL33836.1 hypothetical protein [Porphyromonadaceae bacterium]HBX20580.1 hypothetical protein [Porphyromonadaceae bacterium]HCM22031.1 hypothetical protein [Porphyromonadaceae bacterium]